MELFAYKILTRTQWEELRGQGSFAGAPVDIEDGYIHLSTQAQAAETASRHFAGQDDLVLAMVDLAGLPVRWEPSRGGQLFPHLYAPLTKAAVSRHVTLRLDAAGRHIFPAGF